ncbi:hypothetical protein [uncultured Winogradskyella sp.]|uniref:hypothetical protein n=1 Tax=uncultured Winogradskyella sp. TaxID=395353 RepID=UPI0030D93901|tara:strand:- start:56611 stop:56838 length:228 start_codon:yes stop_codon:yes gene_type:complete
MSEELDLITLLFALLGIGIAFKSDIIKAYKIKKNSKNIEAKTKKISTKTSTDDDSSYDFSSSFDSGGSGDSGDFD